uniref:Metalloproteinase inhibitor 2 n=1 Tax=Oncorhynchus tshawytscha TaxID=74940 RepID=A0AAZ3R3N6_ONCTS
MTRYVSSCFITLVVLFLWRVEDIADACRCFPQHPQQAFCNAEVGKTIWEHFTFQVRAINTKMVYSQDSPTLILESCFPVGFQANPYTLTHYLLSVGKLKTGRMSITLCGYNPPWEDLSAAQKNSLTHLYQSGCDCKIIRCTSLPCPISTSDTCLWTDWGTDNGQNLACIKRPDGSCFLDIGDS